MPQTTTWPADLPTKPRYNTVTNSDLERWYQVTPAERKQMAAVLRFSLGHHQCLELILGTERGHRIRQATLAEAKQDTVWGARFWGELHSQGHRDRYGRDLQQAHNDWNLVFVNKEISGLRAKAHTIKTPQTSANNGEEAQSLASGTADHGTILAGHTSTNASSSVSTSRQLSSPPSTHTKITYPTFMSTPSVRSQSRQSSSAAERPPSM